MYNIHNNTSMHQYKADSWNEFKENHWHIPVRIQKWHKYYTQLSRHKIIFLSSIYRTQKNPTIVIKSKQRDVEMWPVTAPEVGLHWLEMPCFSRVSVIHWSTKSFITHIGIAPFWSRSLWNVFKENASPESINQFHNH